MISYRFNLLSLGFPESSYKEVLARSEILAKGASAVDTGAYRKGWKSRLSGDFLFVSNNVRYAAPVELGSIVHKRHKYKVRDALSTLGLKSGVVDLGQGVKAPFSISANAGQTRKTLGRPKPIILSVAEVISPALLLKRFRPDPPKIQGPESRSKLFNIAYLLGLLEATKEDVNEQVEQN
jgi:hypothetical protein